MWALCSYHLAPPDLPGCHRCPDSEAAVDEHTPYDPGSGLGPQPSPGACPVTHPHPPAPCGSLPAIPLPESGWLEKMLGRELEPERKPELEPMLEPPGDPKLQETSAYESWYLPLPGTRKGGSSITQHARRGSAPDPDSVLPWPRPNTSYFLTFLFTVYVCVHQRTTFSVGSWCLPYGSRDRTQVVKLGSKGFLSE